MAAWYFGRRQILPELRTFLCFESVPVFRRYQTHICQEPATRVRITLFTHGTTTIDGPNQSIGCLSRSPLVHPCHQRRTGPGVLRVDHPVAPKCGLSGSGRHRGHLRLFPGPLGAGCRDRQPTAPDQWLPVPAHTPLRTRLLEAGARRRGTLLLRLDTVRQAPHRLRAIGDAPQCGPEC